MAKKRIGELLVESGYVTVEQVNRALEVQKTKQQKICSIMIDLGYLSEKDFLEFLSATPGIASVELSSCEIDHAVLDIVPKELARKLELVPIGKIGSLLTVAMICPLDTAAQEELERVTGYRIKPVLCSHSAFFKAFARYYGDGAAQPAPTLEENLSTLEGPMKLRGVAKLVEDIEELPTLPDILNVISSIANDPGSSAADLAKVISSDSALSAKILKLANSAAFGFSRKISSIKHAIALLGFNETQALALSACVFDYLLDHATFDLKAHWNHSFACATLARMIAFQAESRLVETAFLAGLFHDVGKVALTMSMRGKQEKVSSLLSSGDMTTLEAEEEVCGLTHAEAGYLLGEHWLLPPSLTNAIRYHHSPELEPEPKSLASIVFLANASCKVQPPQAAKDKSFDEKELDALKVLEIPEDSLRRTLELYGDIASEITVF